MTFLPPTSLSADIQNFMNNYYSNFCINFLLITEIRDILYTEQKHTDNDVEKYENEGMCDDESRAIFQIAFTKRLYNC